jgi:hypothetical protein
MAVGQASFRRALGKGPLISAVGIDQEELDPFAIFAIADGGDLKGQRLFNARRTHTDRLLARYFKDVNVQRKLCTKGYENGY